MLAIDELKKIFAKEKEEILHDYFTFLSFKSLSADPSFRNELHACALWVENYLKKCRFSVQRWEKKEGAPVIFAQNHDFDPQKETLLLYCHYDVQPPDPLDLWTTPPFQPTLRNNKVYARGASDNKGQCFYTMRALKTLLEKKGTLGVNIKFLIEGEEESGSFTLSSLLKEKKSELQADHILIIDSGIHAIDQPAITLGARGLVTMTITLKETNCDLHSGSYGGAVYNPNRALVELLSSTHDKNNKVTIDHFYEDIQTVTPEEKKHYNLTFDTHHFMHTFGARVSGMEKGIDAGEAIALRPTLEINGISGGYSGAGFKTVIPAQAVAKVSCRLVPNQHPDKVGNLVKEYFISQVPKDFSIDVEIHPGKGEGLRTSPNSKIAQVMRQAYSDVFNKECAQILLGGSIPISAELQKVANADLILMGVALPEDRIHSPDESFSLDCLELGFLTLCRGLELLEKMKL